MLHTGNVDLTRVLEHQGAERTRDECLALVERYSLHINTTLPDACNVLSPPVTMHRLLVWTSREQVTIITGAF